MPRPVWCVPVSVNFFQNFHSFFRIFFGFFRNFFLSDASAVCLVPLQVPVLRAEPLRFCPPTRTNKGSEKTEVCAGSDMFQLRAVDTYLSDTCQHPMGTRLVVPVLVCFGSHVVSVRWVRFPAPVSFFVLEVFFVRRGCLSVVWFSERVSKPVASRGHDGFTSS